MLNLDNVPQNNTVVEYKHRGATFTMRITSSRVRYGQIDVQLTPVDGTGSFWVRYDSLLSKTLDKTASEVIETL